jgi:hypothetical protein
LKRSLVGLAILAFALVGCSSSGLVLNAEESVTTLCAPGHDPIPVETLDTQKKASCKLGGVDLLFPDGTHLTVDEGAASGSSTTYAPGAQKTYMFYSVGIYGFVAGVGDPGCQVGQSWGSTVGKAKVREAFGKNWVCDQ